MVQAMHPSRDRAEVAAPGALAPGGDRFGRMAWFARSSIAPPLAIALACLFVVVNEAGYRTVSAITQARDAAVSSRIAIGRMRGAILASESAQRGLLLTERPVYRQNFELALAGVGAAVEELRQLDLQRSQEREQLGPLLQAAAGKLSELRETVNLFDAGRRTAAIELTLSDIGREQMAEIDRRVAALVQAQTQELRESGQRRDNVMLYSRFSILALVLSCLAAVLSTMRLLRHRNSERLAYLQALRSERDKLEEAVACRTLELSDLTRHLQTVREDERAHLARELHDELGGLLTAAKLDLARMRSRLLHAGPEVAERMAHLHATLDAGIALKRRIIEDLRPSSLDNLGLVPALRILCEEWSAGSEIAVEQDIEPIALPPERALVVYRLVQEALTNVAKYAQANRVGVRLSAAGGQAQVQVSDDGRGFAATRRTLGHSLAGMRFRVASTGGQLTVESEPGHGTTIRALLPLQD
jgi:signal transduction histidine kinase